MQTIKATRVFIAVIAVFSLNLMVGCAGLEKSPANRTGYFYPTSLVKADQALDEARIAGKDKECPAEFNALKDSVDKAYEVYLECRTLESVKMAKELIDKIHALCPGRSRVEMKPVPLALRPSEMKVVEKVIILEDVHFDNDKSTLTKEAQTILRRNIRVVKDNPNAKIRIQGHTSAVATEEYNQKLSERRAASVNEFLINEGGIAPNKLSKIGYGETKLEMPEPTPEFKESDAAKTNRRVIFKIIVE